MKKSIVLAALAVVFCFFTSVITAEAWMPNTKASLGSEGYDRPVTFGGCHDEPCSWPAVDPFNQFEEGEWGVVAEESGWVSIFYRHNKKIVVHSKSHESVLESTERLNNDQPEDGGRFIEIIKGQLWRWVLAAEETFDCDPLLGLDPGQNGIVFHDDGEIRWISSVGVAVSDGKLWQTLKAAWRKDDRSPSDQEMFEAMFYNKDSWEIVSSEEMTCDLSIDGTSHKIKRVIRLKALK